uniref:Uncharacterized protein n=1 Tax=Rhizophora mucronata TaxID=61149 RepID=A0A2P2QRG6_RHIMU
MWPTRYWISTFLLSFFSKSSLLTTKADVKVERTENNLTSIISTLTS